MKRAPIIPKPSVSTSNTAATAVPAAPMVDSLIARVGAMAKGNTITLPICGRNVKLTLETISGDLVESKTSVWSGNERDQELLTEEALDDLIPSFLLTGQQNPAFGRRVGDKIEVADGSRRRMTAILTSSEYRILTGDLDDEQMDSLCKLGNDYRPTSAYERGKRYSYRLANEFGGNISALSDAENLSRKVITRCINTSKLPREIIALFSHPGELSARSGELLQKKFEENPELFQSHCQLLADKKRSGATYEPDELIETFLELLKTKKPGQDLKPVKRAFLPGAMAQYKGSKVILTLDMTKLPESCLSEIESIFEKLASTPS